MDIYDEGIIEIWRAFKKHHLQCIIVGGFAVNLHGFHRTTGDIDIWIKDEIPNRIALRNVLIELNYGDMLQILTIDFVPGQNSFVLNDGFGIGCYYFPQWLRTRKI